MLIVVASDTWGISGSDFLLIYAALAVAVAVAIAVRRRTLLGSPFGGRSTELLDYQLAVLNGGPELAVTVAAARLRTARVLEPGATPKTLRVRKRPKHPLDPLEAEVFAMVQDDPGVTTRAIRQRLASGPTLTELCKLMRDDGLLLDQKTARRLRLLCLWPLPLLALGIVRLGAGVHNHKPIAYLTVAVLAVLAAMAWLALQRPRASAKGSAALETARGQRANWRRAPKDIAPPLAVALFGGGALWVVDPVFAAACSIPREIAGGGRIISGTGFYGGGGCGGGSNCGGGGSSCGGGGSSCGGGGGGCGG